MRDDRYTSPEKMTAPVKGDGVYRFVIVTLDAHAAGPAARVAPALVKDFPGIQVTVHAATSNPISVAAIRAAAITWVASPNTKTRLPVR